MDEWEISKREEMASDATIRDYFAAKAMQAWLTQIDPEETEDMMERWAENSYEFADCMLKIRKK